MWFTRRRRTTLLRLGLVALGVQWVHTASADSWTTPYRKTAHSPSRRFEVLVEPSDSSSTAGATITLWEKADGNSLMRYQRRSVNQWSPVSFYVGDDGSLVTFDDWLRAGYDHAVVVYSPSGDVVRDSILDDVLRPDELKKVERSVSSRRWVYLAEPVRTSESRLILTTIWGAAFTIDLKTGAITRAAGHFQNLVRLAQGDLQMLARLEYEHWNANERLRCSWKADEAACETIDKDWQATPLFRKRHPLSRLRGQLASVADLLDHVESPTYSTAGSDREEFRLFFNHDGFDYAYSVVLQGASLKSAAVRGSFGRLLRGASFDAARVSRDKRRRSP